MTVVVLTCLKFPPSLIFYYPKSVTIESEERRKEGGKKAGRKGVRWGGRKKEERKSSVSGI
jgi:hypothetical protein